MKLANEIPSLIATIQSNEVLRKVAKQKEKGYFKSEEEYSGEMRAQLVAAAQRDGGALFSFRPLVPGVAYPEYINKSVEDIVSDLNVVFSELSYLFSKIRSHEIFFERTNDEVQNLLTKLEMQLEATQIEAGLGNVYNKIHHDSFLDASSILSLNHLKANELFYDKREKREVLPTTLSEMNTKTGDLTIQKFSDESLRIAGINIVSSETTVSDFDIQLPSATTQNLVSDSPSDTWSYQVLTRKKLKEPAKLVLDIDLGDKQEVNQMLISPNAGIPVLFSEVSYENESGETIEVESDLGVLSTDKLITFPTVIARRFKISMSQDKMEDMPFDATGQVTTLQDLQRDPSLSLNISSISQQVAEQVKDPGINNILGLKQNAVHNNILLNKYTFSLASIKIGVSNYKNRGDFVSKPIETAPVSLVGLNAAEVIGEVRDAQTGQMMPSASIEYSVVKKDYSKERMLRTQDFCILPPGETEVSCELMFFGESKTQALRFIGHAQDGDASSVKIFRNGEELILGIDWRFQDRRDVLDTESFILKENLFTTRVTILQTEEQIENGVYYAGYSPRYTSLESSFENGVTYLKSGVTKHALTFAGEDILRSEIFAKIILRNLTNAGSSSPRVQYYRLLLKEENNDE